MVVPFRTRSLPLLLTMWLGAILIAGLVLLSPDPWTALSTGLLALGAGTGLGLAARTRWHDRPRLEACELAWALGDHPYDLLVRLGAAAWPYGEFGYRFHLMRATLRLALGQRDRAWLAYLDAQLARLPLWKRLLVSRAFRKVPTLPSPARLAWGQRLLRLAPRVGRLHHLQGILLLRGNDPEPVASAWSCFEAALPLSWEDPLLLEDLLMAGLHHGREDLAERALAVLVTRHGDPRLPWDRSSAALYLLRKARHPEALALVRHLPPERRTEPLLWLAESVSLRQLGDREAAWRVVEEALFHLPGAFRLWMERYHIALELHHSEIALETLEKAWLTIPEGAEGDALRVEWHLRRAEYAFWWEDDPSRAREQLDLVPPDQQGDHHPPLWLQVRVAEGAYEEAYGDVVEQLRSRPEDVDLLLLQADCLAGMAAWEALRPFLEGLPEPCREEPAFWHLRGLCAAHLEDPQAARIDLERAARMDPRTLRFLLDAGHACSELGDWDRAEGHWRQALQVEPRSEEALLHLAEARRELLDHEGARRYLRECLLHHPDSREAQAHLAELEAN